MKIKLSRSKWEDVGRKSGWIKCARNEDSGRKYELVDLKMHKQLDTKCMNHEEHVTRNRALKEDGLDQRWDVLKD